MTIGSQDSAVLSRPLVTPVIRRPRLDEVFRGGVDRGQVLAVFAAAGAGKSTQARLYTESQPRPVVWIDADRTLGSSASILSLWQRSLAEFAKGERPRGSVQREMSPSAQAADLAARLDGRDVLIVMDSLEKAVDPASLGSLLDAFIENLPAGAKLILCSRVELDISLGSLVLSGRVARVSGEQLALTMDEAGKLSAATDGVAPHPQPLAGVKERWRSSRGWLAGFLLSRENAADPARDLHPYLRREVLQDLSEPEQRFLLETALLEKVSLTTARRMCGPTLLAQSWSGVVARHLPAIVGPDRTIEHHPVFREFLLEELELRLGGKRRQLQWRLVEILLEEDRAERAIEVCLDIDEIDAAADAAELAYPALIDRGDSDTVLRWINAFGRRRVDARPRLLAGEIMALRASRRLNDCRALVRRLAKEGRLADVLESDARAIICAGSAMLWQPVDGLALLETHDNQRRAAGLRYLFKVLTGDDPASPPRAQAWPEDSKLVTWGNFLQGRLDDLMAMLPSSDSWPPRTPYVSPHPLLALVWRGELQQARALLGEVLPVARSGVHQDLWLHLEIWLLLAEGDTAGAAEVADRAVDHSRRTGFGFEPEYQIIEAGALVDAGHIEQARALVDESLAACRSAGVVAYVEWALTVLGKIHLVTGQATEAESVLQECVTSMVTAQRDLMLPLAGVYLAEACRRLGNVDQARCAAEIAYEASTRMSTFFALTRALTAFPGVLELMRQGAGAARWQRLRGPGAQGSGRATVIENESTLATLQPLGSDPYLLVDGDRVDIRRTKVLEFIALLSSRSDGLLRDELRFELFPHIDRARGGNYFRQVAHQVRRKCRLEMDRLPGGEVRWAHGVVVESLDVKAQQDLEHASTLMGTQKLAALRQAIDSIPGQYLERSELDWAIVRRVELQALLEDATKEAAALAWECREFDAARRYALDAIKIDPYSEAAYRVLIDVELAVGTAAGATSVHRQLSAAMREMGLEPTIAPPVFLAS